MVGAVIVRDGRLLGQGYHRRFGGPHAEINAFADARRKGHSVKGATLYVTLEPCCHWGKTPPCTEAVIAAGIGTVIIAAKDPSTKVAGKGVAALRKAGIDVRVGLLEADARALNASFFHFHQTGRPWVICKWAQTLDGKLAARTGQSKWISSEASRREVHRLRQTCQAVVVGIGTVRADDPRLTVRLDSRSIPAGRAPNRVVLDAQLRTPLSSYLVSTAREIPTWIISSPRAAAARAKRLEAQGVHVVRLPLNAKGRIDLRRFLAFAGRQGWERILIEGGADVLACALLSKLADEIIVFQTSALALDEEAVQLGGREARRVTQFEGSYRLEDAIICDCDLMMRLLRR